MRFEIPEGVRIKIGDTFLDWAERLPELKPLKPLRIIREHQRQQAASAFEGARAPQGTRLELLFLRMIEMFPLEDLDRLQRGIVELFPGLNGSQPADFADVLRELTGRLSGSGWCRLGTLSRSAKEWVGLPPDRVMPELPPEVERIDVVLHVVTPSFLVVALDVHVGDSATKSLEALQGSRYLPVIRFSRLLPIGPGFGLSGTPSEAQMTRAILSWLDQLRSGVEGCVRPFLDGYFFHQTIQCEARLPTVEVYALHGPPEDDEQFARWKQDARGWWQSFGLDMHLNVFGNKEFLFSWSADPWHVQKMPESHRPVGHLIALWEPCVRTADAHLYGGDTRLAVRSKASDLLTEMLPWISYLRFLESVERHAVEGRQVVLSSVSSKAQFERRVKLMDNVQQSRMLVDRIASEFNVRTAELNDKKASVVGFRYAGMATAWRDRTLAGDWLERIKLQTGQLQSHFSQMDSLISASVATQSMISARRLEVAMLVLAIVTLFATLVEVVVNWSDFVALLQGLVK